MDIYRCIDIDIQVIIMRRTLTRVLNSRRSKLLDIDIYIYIYRQTD